MGVSQGAIVLMLDMDFVDVAVVVGIFVGVLVHEYEAVVEEGVARAQLVVVVHALVVCIDMEGVEYNKIFLWRLVVFRGYAEDECGVRRLVVDVETEYRRTINLYIRQHGHRVVVPIESPRRHHQ